VKERVVPESEGGAAAGVTAVAPEWMPAIDARLTRIGTSMLLIADVFFYAAFFFAFFYLRALNNNYSWLPAGTTHPTRAIGALIVVLAVATALLYLAAMRNVGTGRGLLWLALAAGILCIGLQVYEFRNLGFDPQQGGGYPSVFVGLKGSLTVQFAGALIWLTTHIAQAGLGGDLEIRPATAGYFGNFLLFLAGISLIAYLVLYFV
jgi:heme/copper-type cytochrome/quinol oxidase subunit 3